MVKKNNCHWWRWSPFWGAWEHARQEKFWKFMLQMRPFGAILHHFISFFFHLLNSKNFSRLWLDKDIRNGELLIILLYPFVGSSSTRRYEIYSLSKSSVWKLSGFSMHTKMFTESAVHPLLLRLEVDFIKGSISQPRCLEVSSLHLFLQSSYL